MVTSNCNNHTLLSCNMYLGNDSKSTIYCSLTNDEITDISSISTDISSIFSYDLDLPSSVMLNLYILSLNGNGTITTLFNNGNINFIVLIINIFK